MPDEAALVEAYRAATGAVQVRVGAQAAAEWLTMTSWSDAASEALLARVVPLVLAGQRQTAATTAAYVARVTGSALPRLDVAEFIGASVRNGADPIEVYARAVREARVVYNRSDLVDLAVNRGLQQLVGTVQTDLQLSATHAARGAMRAAGVDVYRRVTRAGACGLCVAASDRVYQVADLLPIHRGCYCKPLPGGRLPRGLRRPDNQTDPTDGRGLVIDDNGEIGPVLDYADRVKGARGGGTSVGVTRESITPAQALELKRRQLAANQAAIDGGADTPHMRRLAAGLRAEVASMQAAMQASA